MTGQQTQQAAILQEKTLLTLLRLDLPQGWIPPLLDMMDYCNGHLHGLFVMFKWQYISAGRSRFSNVQLRRQMMCLRCK